MQRELIAGDVLLHQRLGDESFGEDRGLAVRDQGGSEMKAIRYWFRHKMVMRRIRVLHLGA